MRLLRLLVLLATTAVAVVAGASAAPTASSETPPANLDVVLQDVTGGHGFGLVKFRQPKDHARIIYLDTSVRNLQPNRDYQLQRQVDGVADGDCSDTESLSPWLTLGEGLMAKSITTDERGAGHAALFRDLDPPGPMTGPPAGTQFDIQFRLIDSVTSITVLASACYRYTVTE